MCMDLLKILPLEGLVTSHLELLLEIFKLNRRKKHFYEGRKPTFEDVKVLAEWMSHLKKNDPAFVDSDVPRMLNVIREVLQKAITDSFEAAPATASQQEVSLRHDLAFIQSINSLYALGLFDQKNASLVLFEVASQLKQERPFTSQEQANARLRVLLFSL